MLEDWELAAARDAAAAATLTDSCTISRPTNSPDSYGGRTVGVETVASSVPCRVYAEPSFGRYAAGIEGAASAFLVSFPYGTEVLEQDVISASDDSWELTVTRLAEPDTWALLTNVEAYPKIR